MLRTLLIAIPLAFSLAGCQTTPGDAAVRSGHPQQAAALYQKGAEQGDPKAALKLGLLIDAGEVSPNTYGSAGKWFKTGCELGNVPSCHNTGVAFEYGKNGLAQSYEHARSYYQKAAELGYMQSQYNLASLYSNQYFSDDVEGLKWMLIAQAIANKCSSNSLCQWIRNDPPGHQKKLRSRMSAEQLAAAEASASKWLAQH
jgi:TPR repeat protein